MALKTPKSPLQTETTAETISTATVAIAALDIENLIADSLIQDINWQKVRTALIDRARQKFGSDPQVVKRVKRLQCVNCSRV